MVTVTKKDLVALGYGNSFATDIIRLAKIRMVEKGYPFYSSRKLDRDEECDRRAIETERIGTTERPEQSALEKAPVKWPGLSFPEIDDCFALSSYFVAPQEEHLYPVVTVSSHASRTCTCSS